MRQNEVLDSFIARIFCRCFIFDLLNLLNLSDITETSGKLELKAFQL